MMDIKQNIGNSLVAIEPGWSAGFFVSPRLIVTAGHCLRNRPSPVEIHLKNTNVIFGHIVSVDFETDIGLICVDPNSHNQPALPLAERDSFSNFDARAVLALLMRERGYHGHVFEVVDGALLYEIKCTPWKESLIYTTIKSRQGFSGAPVLMGDKVCGILVAGTSQDDGLAVPSRHIKSFIEKSI